MCRELKRGIPEILEVDQKEASTYRTTRAIAIDFAGKPFLSGHRRSTPFRFRAGEYCISTGVSGRSVNQHRTLASLTNMGQLASVIESMTQTLGPESVKAFMLWIFNTVDTELARRIQGAGVRKQESGVRMRLGVFHAKTRRREG
ncbi:MAG: hypothetical protein WCK89_19605 [bacterium]